MTKVPEEHKGVPIGPIHSSFYEPIRLKLETLGEKIKEGEFESGFARRNITEIMEGKKWDEGIYLSSRISGINSGFHNLTFVEALEDVQEVKIPDRAEGLRIVVSELNRIQSHLFANAFLNLSIEHETLFMWLMDLREKVLDWIEKITGHRVILDYFEPGGVRLDIEKQVLNDLVKELFDIVKKVQNLEEFIEAGPISIRLKEVGELRKRNAKAYSVTGPIARASGLEKDSRSSKSAYTELGFEPVHRLRGDVYARVCQRFDEIKQSINLIKRAVSNLSSGEIKSNIEDFEGKGYAENEAPRGKLTYRVEIEGNILENVSISSPTNSNLKAFIYHLVDDIPTLPDTIATFISMDPSIACMEK